jgi:hypothetical protein
LDELGEALLIEAGVGAAGAAAAFVEGVEVVLATLFCFGVDCHGRSLEAMNSRRKQAAM